MVYDTEGILVVDKVDLFGVKLVRRSIYPTLAALHFHPHCTAERRLATRDLVLDTERRS